MRPTVEQVWAWLDEVHDPEIPVISVVDLGIVRDVRWEEGQREELVVSITPTYSGCPATSVIAHDIQQALRDRGITALRLERRIAPPWTTDWISQKGRQRLAEFGIAPPVAEAPAVFPSSRLAREPLAIECPRCGSGDTTRVSQFGSTPCKAQYTCRECLEPFEYFKCL
jgi:ring-1,2-phenylacetyl-CoA epoxidase subunit PaaD